MNNFELSFKALRELMCAGGDSSYMINYLIIRAFKDDGLVSYEALGTSNKELMVLCLRGARHVVKELLELSILVNRANMTGAKIDRKELSRLICSEQEIVKRLENGHDIF